MVLSLVLIRFSTAFHLRCALSAHSAEEYCATMRGSAGRWHAIR